MFNEDEEWNDEEDAQMLSKNVFKSVKKVNRNQNVLAKGVGKKSLLRTLQTLGSVPEWKSNNNQQDSDSEVEVPPSQGKKKKKRRKRKPADEQKDVDGDISQGKPVLKKEQQGKKTGQQPKSVIPSELTKTKETPKAAGADVHKPQGVEKLSRQQWKNKMKNKRKCQNKYRPTIKVEGTNEEKNSANQQQKKEPEADSLHKSRNSQKLCQTPILKVEKQKRKVLKRKNADVDSHSVSEQNKQNTNKKTKGSEGENNTTKYFTDGSQPEADEPSPPPTLDDSKDEQFSAKKQKLELSKEQRLKRQKLRNILKSTTEQPEETAEKNDPPLSEEEKEKEDEEKPEELQQSRSDMLRSRMEQRLESARFRYINEALYSTSSGEAKRMFQQDPQAFSVYHKGYTAQVLRWPVNPVDQIISSIKRRPSSLVVADFGCGDCKIARSVKNRVHCFDLAAACELVTVCDMAKVPLEDSSVDIVVFCLSLMGTNLADFLAEANRVLKMGGTLKVAEVASRFENVRDFITALSNLGFKSMSKDVKNTHFYSFEFVKTKNSPKNVKKFGLQLKPCLYKKR